MYTILSYLFYSLAVIAGYIAAYDLLLQIFPEYGLLEILVGFVATAMFFPLVPVYSGFTIELFSKKFIDGNLILFFFPFFV